MMRLARRAALLIAFYVLTWAATASAECAWLLWQNIETIRNLIAGDEYETRWVITAWEPTSGYASRKDCMDALRSQSQEWPKTVKIGDTRNIYRCLPDTVDPRGPKGK